MTVSRYGSQYSQPAGNYSNSSNNNGKRTIPRDIKLPRVKMSIDIWQRMHAYAQAALPTEINGLGFTSRTVEDGQITFEILDIVILEQEATAGSVEMNEKAVQEFLYQHLAAGGDTAEINFQWHTHPSGNTIFSATDTSNMERWGLSCGKNLLISTVLTPDGKHNTRIDVYDPVRLGYELELEIVSAPLASDALQAIQDEVKAKVKPKKYTPPAKKAGSKFSRTPTNGKGKKKPGKKKAPKGAIKNSVAQKMPSAINPATKTVVDDTEDPYFLQRENISLGLDIPDDENVTMLVQVTP